MKDLVILVADANMEQAVRGLFLRPQALGVQTSITFDVFKHPRRDPGVFHGAHEFLRPFQSQYRYALVMLDREGSGQEEQSSEEIEQTIQGRLDGVGWRGRSAVVVLDPELEAWVFSDSPHVIRVIAGGDAALYHQVLNAQQRLDNGKPVRPKEAMEEILRRKRIPRSSGLYQDLATRVSLLRCSDRSFQRFRQILQRWFPHEPNT